jgi:hypothetical protein
MILKVITIALATVITYFYVARKIKINRSEDSEHSIQTELRLRNMHKTIENRLSAYTTTELIQIQQQLQEVFIKKRFDQPLNSEEKILLIKFPNSYQVIEFSNAWGKKPVHPHHIIKPRA